MRRLFLSASLLLALTFLAAAAKPGKPIKVSHTPKQLNKPTGERDSQRNKAARQAKTCLDSVTTEAPVRNAIWLWRPNGPDSVGSKRNRWLRVSQPGSGTRVAGRERCRNMEGGGRAS